MPEKVLMKFRPSRLVFLKSYLLSFLFLGFGAVSIARNIPLPSLVQYISLANVLILLGVLIIIITEIRGIFYRYVVTDQRIVEYHGILSKSEVSVPLRRIAHYSIKQNFVERVVGIGNIVIESTGGSERPEILIKAAPRVKRLKQILDKNVHL